MHNFYIIVSETEGETRERVLNTEDRLAQSLKRHEGVRVGVHSGFIDRDFSVPDETECVITIGGDGTMLRAARAAYGKDVRFIGINRGHMGYLTEITGLGDVDDAGYLALADALVGERFMVDERMMLSACAYRGGQCLHRDFALNDVLFGKNDSIRMISFDVFIHDTLLNSYKADGIVVSSPTGSTGYSMSAGGPIADPRDRLLIVTPICPHSINTRAMVLSADTEVRIRAGSEAQLFSCDGAEGTPLEFGDELCVTRSETTMKFIRFRETSFLDTLRERMRPV